MSVQDAFAALHEAFAAALEESSRVQAQLKRGGTAETWLPMADKLEKHQNRIDGALVDVFKALETSQKDEPDPKLR